MRSSRERVRLRHIFNDIISIENLIISWQEFLVGKRRRKDILTFSLNLTDNIICLHNDLVNKTYKHGKYFAFKINDPKTRDIHKASVRDRLLHHAIYRIIYPYFDRKFIFDSYSCRFGKGTHKAINRFRQFGRKVSRNNSTTAWILKCDIRKFFANIDHQILKNILEKHIDDSDVIWLLGKVIDSFNSGKEGTGLPLGNLTSQILVNIYMNEFDQFVKRKLKVKYYIRYADDFVFFSENRFYLENLIPKIAEFLEKELKLEIHPSKVFIRTSSSGVDFLGWINFPHHRVLRKSTERRMFRRIKQYPKQETLTSYFGLLGHGNSYKLANDLLERY